MTFRVRWTKRALDRLTALWLVADSATRKRLTAASNAIDQHLRIDPDGQSESRPKGRRVAFFPPLGVYYRVGPPDGQTVTVLRIYLIGKRK